MQNTSTPQIVRQQRLNLHILDSEHIAEITVMLLTY